MGGFYIGQWWKGKAIDERKLGQTGGDCLSFYQLEKETGRATFTKTRAKRCLQRVAKNWIFY